MEEQKKQLYEAHVCDVTVGQSANTLSGEHVISLRVRRIYVWRTACNGGM